MVNGSHMLNYKKKIVFTGGTGRFGQVLKKTVSKSNINICTIKHYCFEDQIETDTSTGTGICRRRTKNRDEDRKI